MSTFVQLIKRIKIMANYWGDIEFAQKIVLSFGKKFKLED